MAVRKKTQEAIDAALSANMAKGQVGLGVDLVEIDRMRAVLKRTPGFAQRVFSEDEREYCESHADPAAYYATRFAAKEAVVKALGTGFSEGVSFRDIEVVRQASGKPEVRLSGRALDVADSNGVIEIPISLTHTRSDAICCAIAITGFAKEKTKVKQGSVEELAKRFKEMRGMLDEIGEAK